MGQMYDGYLCNSIGRFAMVFYGFISDAISQMHLGNYAWIYFREMVPRYLIYYSPRKMKIRKKFRKQCPNCRINICGEMIA